MEKGEGNELPDFQTFLTVAAMGKGPIKQIFF